MPNDETLDAQVLAHLSLAAIARLAANLNKSGALGDAAIGELRLLIETQAGKMRTDRANRLLETCLESFS